MVYFLHFLWSWKQVSFEVIWRCFPQVPFWLLCANEEGWAGLTWTFQQSLSIHDEKDWSDPISKLTPYNVFCTSGYTFAILYFKNILLQSSNKELPAWYQFDPILKEKFLLLRYMTDVPGVKWDGHEGQTWLPCPSASHFIIQLYPVLFTQLRPSHKQLLSGPEGAHL